MDKKQLFLEALNASMNGRTLQWEQLQVGEWLDLLEIAGIHHLLEYIYPVVANSPAGHRVDHRFLLPFEKQYRRMAVNERDSRCLSGIQLTSTNMEENLFVLIETAGEHLIQGTMDMRYVCDILLYARSCESRMEWKRVYRMCEEKQLTAFASAIFRIGSKYLGTELDGWESEDADEEPLLQNLLAVGMYDELDPGVITETENSREHRNSLSAAIARRLSMALGLGDPEERNWEMRRKARMEQLQLLMISNRDQVIQLYSLG